MLDRAGDLPGPAVQPQGGNRVGAILYDNAAAAGDPAPHRPQPRAAPDPRADRARRVARPTGAPPTWPRCCDLAAATARRRSLVFVISDFIGDADWEPALARLSQRHEVVAMRVVDPMELDLPDLGLVLVEDAETGEQLLADTSDPLFRQRFRAEVDGPGAAVAASMRRAGVTAHRSAPTRTWSRRWSSMVRRSKRQARDELPVPL